MEEMVQTLIGANGKVILSLASGGTGAANAAGARGNLIVPERWKKLWVGNWSDGSITIPNVWDYFELLVFIAGGQLWEPMLLERMDTRLYHGSGCAEHVWTESTGLYQRHFTLALSGTEDDNATLSYNYMTSANLGGTGNGIVSDAHWPIRAIYGTSRSADIQEG